MITCYLLIRGGFSDAWWQRLQAVTMMYYRSTKSRFSKAQKALATALLLFILTAVIHSTFLCAHATQQHVDITESCCNSRGPIPASDSQEKDYGTTEKVFCAFCLFLKAHLLIPQVGCLHALECIPNIILNRNECSHPATRYWTPALPRPPPNPVYA